ncbi:unnamed protein product [Protopolystoma xenopodis]|uniref:Uncharacterized protein n=1 Tax=Protopolystoma xenopodis TaxID=117903 RepID=A0A3S5FDQ2_9PLAT|nr:unnamed protein product [Protopolystoma xenopodis]
MSPLHMAAQVEHAEAARMILMAGASSDDITLEYLTPLHVAAHCGNIQVAEVLLDKKCNVNARALVSHAFLFYALIVSDVQWLECV